jgi:hypothetical protein
MVPAPDSLMPKLADDSTEVEPEAIIVTGSSPEPEEPDFHLPLEIIPVPPSKMTDGRRVRSGQSEIVYAPMPPKPRGSRGASFKRRVPQAPEKGKP